MMKWDALKRPFLHNKLFFKILLYFLSLLVPIVIIGFIAYLNVDRLIKKDVSDKLAANLASSSKTIDIYLSMAQSTNNNLLLSDVVQNSLKPQSLQSDQDKLGVISIVRALAGNRSTLSAFVDNIFLYVDEEKVYSNDGAISFNDFFGTHYQFERYPIEFWRQKQKTTGFFELLPPTAIANMFGNTGKTVIPSVTTQYVNGHMATMVTTVSVPAILASLRNNSLFASTAYVITDAKNRVLMSSSNVEAAAIDQLALAEAREPGKPVIVSLAGYRAPVMVAHTASETFGWHYYTMTPVTAFNRDATSILSLILWICVSLFLIGGFFSFIFSVSLYNPIKNIKRILQQNETDLDIRSDADGTGELHMLGNRLDHLLQHNRNMTRKMSNELTDQFFASLLNGQPLEKNITVQQLLDDLGFTDGVYLCCCFLFAFKERFYRDLAEPDRLLIQEKMNKLLWGIMRQYVNCYLMEHEPNVYVCMVNLRRDEDRHLLDRALDSIRVTFEYDLIYCELAIGLGKTYPHVGDLAQSYSDAITAIEQRAEQPNAFIADAAHLNIEQQYYYSFLDENKVLNGLKSGELDALEAAVEQIVNANKEHGVSHRYLGALLAEMFQTGYRYITEKRLSVHRFVTEGEYAALQNRNMLPKEMAERTALLLRFYEKIIHETALKPERKTGTVVSLITQYIETNYAKDLYLESISDEIGLSAKYVSRLFKETTGSTITDYISLVRMAKAKELLAETDLKISDIADSIGIFSRTTFLRLFKKYEGISPQEYRNAVARKREQVE